MTWCPESSKIKQKMLYSSSYDALKKALVGVYKYVQACDFEEASQEAIEDAFRKGGKWWRWHTRMEDDIVQTQ